MKNYTITVNGTAYSVTVEEGAASAPVYAQAAPAPSPAAATVPLYHPQAAPAPAVPAPAPAPAPAASSVVGTAGAVEVAASVPGKVFAIPTQVGQQLKAGDPVVVLEAMKMEIPVVAQKDGTVASINVSVGDAVESGDLLATMN
ncbi:MAG: biotin/lipoyl-binding carrier protein [Lachnospiraceae bacterium]|jgi:biotin carboxyl carrier protein|nr:biotin/lipoyl-binding carrier protein [Lachnospiraceae bacterium]MCI1726756.1 biotin/lipoyl-binding carrier protein [Lachnospiraceae bacterium]